MLIVATRGLVILTHSMLHSKPSRSTKLNPIFIQTEGFNVSGPRSEPHWSKCLTFRDCKKVVNSDSHLLYFRSRYNIKWQIRNRKNQI